MKRVMASRPWLGADTRWAFDFMRRQCDLGNAVARQMRDEYKVAQVAEALSGS